MNKQIYNILLADDDEDDCSFFEEALDELSLATTLVTVNDGVQLMDFLADKSGNDLPDILFLDLNMPRKNGSECLTEIRQIEKLKDFPIVIFSTSLDSEIVDIMYDKDATYYIRKPGDFSKLKSVIENALITASENNFKKPARAHFIIQP
ncbi:response regulator [Flavobacterium johnsoniae]|uniref:Response regulator receiver domain-containing protein n=1 Tax=Flavobacterium johnsoniae TaxID=986 RepID=A0A1M5J7K9_FLAJO|nr:response regulator [Flavobacterium johnsoniae]SHG36230.1 Response regulator receiver domain-containing protein [Flavobacterium johnsoniae]